jgi:K+-transporting ATPase ATPase C chain
MIKLTLQSIRQTIVWTILTGMLYPLVMTVFFQLAFNHQANGSLLEVDGKVVGSEFMAQQFTGPTYFWPRPSAATYGSTAQYNPTSGVAAINGSSGSNLGPTSAQLQTNVRAAAKAFRDGNKLAADAPVPADMVYASASGLDPHISPEAAQLQIARVADARKLPVDQVKALVDKFTEPPQWGFLGQTRVNVLMLNLALDAADTKK